MKAGMLILAALALAPVAAYAHDDAHEQMMHDEAGTFDFACLQPGHFEAGMMGTVSVK
jgi:plastocyanin